MRAVGLNNIIGVSILPPCLAEVIGVATPPWFAEVIGVAILPACFAEWRRSLLVLSGCCAHIGYVCGVSYSSGGYRGLPCRASYK